MKKLIGVAFGVFVTFTFASEGATQGAREMIAYDMCQTEYWLTGGEGATASFAACSSQRWTAQRISPSAMASMRHGLRMDRGSRSPAAASLEYLC
jgi:hypothetical protein